MFTTMIVRNSQHVKKVFSNFQEILTTIIKNTHHYDGDSSKAATNISDLGETSLRYLRNIEIEDLSMIEVILHFNTGFDTCESL